MRSILGSFHEWVGRNPDQLLYAFLNIDGRTTESYTYAQFLQRTTDIAAHIRRTHPMAPGERVLLAYPPGVEMICAFFACVRLGLIPVPVYPPTSHGFKAALAKTDFIARDCQAAAVLTDRTYYWSMKLNETRNSVASFSLKRASVSKLKWIVTTDATRGVRGDFPDAHSDILFLQYTSGSTSEPKGVMVTHENILANCEAVVDHRPIGVSWLPQYHDMGLIGYYLFFALKGGTTYGFSPFDFIQRPALWLETITKYRGTASSAPNFAYEYCLRPEKIPAATLNRLDLSSLRFLMTAAEPVRGKVCRDFLKKFGPYGLDPKAFFSAYGLAEFTLAVSNYGRTIKAFDRAALGQNKVQPTGADAADATTLVSCGRVLGASEVRIVDTVGTPRAVGEHEVGEIWMRGPSKCAGYWRRPELSASIFDARLPGENNGEPTWLRSGDLGFVHDGELYICGRSKDMIIVRGLNYYPQDVEVLVEADSRVRKGCSAAFGTDRDGREALVVVAELKDPRRAPDVADLNRRLQRGLGITAASFVFIAARTIPKTSSGKIVRHQVRARWLAGQLEVLSQVDCDEEILRFAQVGGTSGEPSRAWLKRFGLTGAETWTLDEAGFDSLKLVEFAHELKERLEERGEAELSGSIDLRVLQKIAICELLDLLDQVEAAAPHARVRFKSALAALGREHRAQEAELMRRDTRLRFDVADLTIASTVASAQNGTVLLTGGTGFFGPFLLASLLEQTSDDIHVLVRADTDTAMLRIRDGLRSVAADGVSCPEGWEHRVRPVCGDLASPKLGLTADMWRTLADNVHTIYHNGALVNYLLDYHSMRDANVGGTNEVICLAMSHRPKVLNHISSTFVFGWSVQETIGEHDTNPGMERLDFGYSQSKWVSEHVVRDAMSRGLNARIFRPALITPSLRGGGYNFDVSIRLLAFMLNHGISTTAQNQVSFTPADIAATNIVGISRLPESVNTTLLVTRDDYATLSDISEILGELTGRTFRNYALPEFTPEVIKRCRPGDILFPLLEFLVRSVDNISAMEFKRYDNSNYRRFRDASPAGVPDPSLHDVVLGILRFMRKQGLVKEPCLAEEASHV